MGKRHAHKLRFPNSFQHGQKGQNNNNEISPESDAVDEVAVDTHEAVNEVLERPKLSSTQRMADLKPHKVAYALRKCGARQVRAGIHIIYEKDGIRSPVPLGHKSVNWRTLKDSLKTLGISVEEFIKYL